MKDIPAFPQQDDASGSEGMTLRDQIIRMAREADLLVLTQIPDDSVFVADLERFAALVAAAEREASANKVGEFAQKWWSIHCASNKHLETTRKAHEDFCALQSAIRARGNSG